MNNNEILAALKLVPQSVFTVIEVRNVNFKPHPYVVGPIHLKHSPGMFLDVKYVEDKLKRGCCQHRGCNLRYDEHTSDTVAFLSFNRGVTRREAQEVLKSMEVGGLDGFAFVKSEWGLIDE